ncbi:MAG: hypothetical protein J7M34_13890 [Anaerolineae bacterium]|nr:hypothetical protein [Anaerolineae bacterium]
MGIALLLALAVAWPLTQGVPDPAAWLHRTTGRLDYALQDYREWEPYYHVWAEIKGTWQADHRPISGRFEILSAVEDTLILNIDGRQVTAGQRDEDIYIRRIVAVRGGPRLLAATPGAPATPVIVRIRIDHVLDPEREVLVKPGDQVKRGQIIADLAGYRARLLEPLPTPTPTPTPTWTPTPDLLTIARAEADLALARAEATAAARNAYPRPEDLQAAQAKLALAARELQQAQAAYDKEA